MIQRMLLALTVLLGLTGCFQVEHTISLYPDGSGKISYTIALKKSFEEGGGTSLSTERLDPDELSKNIEGIVAWREPRREEDKEWLRLILVGYFDDINQVKIYQKERSGERVLTGSFSLASSDVGRLLTVVTSQGKENVAQKEKGMKDLPPELAAAIKESMKQMLSDARIAMVIVVPGTVAEAKGWTSVEGRTVKMEVVGEKMQKALDRKVGGTPEEKPEKLSIFWTKDNLPASEVDAFKKELAEAKEQWKTLKEEMKKKSLGLDRQEVLYLVFEVEGDKAVDIAVDRTASSLSGILGGEKVAAEVKKKGLDIIVKPAASEVRKIVEEAYPTLTLAEAGAVLKYRLSAAEVKRLKDVATDQVLEIIRNRIEQLGVAEPTIHRQAENEIVVQLPGVKDPKRAIEIIEKTAQLEFKIVDDQSPIAAELPESIQTGEEQQLLEKFKGKIPKGDEILFQRDVNTKTGLVTKRPHLLKKEVLLSGDLLTEARVEIDQRFNEPHVAISFNSAGAKIFEDVTGQNVKKRLAIILDGNIYSAPVIQERISGGNAQISGSFTLMEAKDLAIVLRSGTLPMPLKLKDWGFRRGQTVAR